MASAAGFTLAMLALIAGADWLAKGSVRPAERLRIAALVIGLTVVAFGTSLPEIVTCVLAAIRGQRDLAVGNVIGRNLVNILCVPGITSATSAGRLPLSATAIQTAAVVAVAESLVARLATKSALSIGARSTFSRSLSTASIPGPERQPTPQCWNCVTRRE